MLARSIGPKYAKFPAYIQPKLNGVRSLFQEGVFQSRDEKLFSRIVLKHLVDELSSIRSSLGTTMLDGELYVHGWRLQKINGAVATNRTSARDDSNQIEFHVFDAIDKRGFSCNFSERWLDTRTWLQEARLNHVKVVRTDYAANRIQADSLFKLYCSQGYEGAMLRPDGPYQTGQTAHGTTFRSPYLWKMKAWKDAEYECVATIPGEGKASVGIGSLTLQNALGVTFQCGTGFTDDERRELAGNPPINKLIKVRYVEMTANGTPYPCTFLAVIS